MGSAYEQMYGFIIKYLIMNKTTKTKYTHAFDVLTTKKKNKTKQKRGSF